MRRNRVLAAAILFLGGVGLGVLVGAPETTQTQSVPSYDSFSLFLHNLKAAAFIASGLLTLGITALLGLLVTGYLVGVGLAALEFELAIVLAIVPHAIFELPAICLCGAVGLETAGNFFAYLRGQRDDIVNRGDLRETALLLGYAVALLAVAAIIETKVSVRITQGLL